MEWCARKDETLGQETIGTDGNKCYVSRCTSTTINVGTIEDAKRKAEEWGLREGESIGTWLGGEDKLWSIISTSDTKIKRSVLHLFIDPTIIIQYTWKKGLIVKDDHGARVTTNMMLIDMTTGNEIKRYVQIKNGKVIKKPKRVEILGEKTEKGFALRGITLKNMYTGEELL
jgi:hypothetical protein